MLESYTELLGSDIVSSIRNKAKTFLNKTVFHLNSTKFGGGVAELLSNMVPLMKELGLEPRWEIFSAPDDFFEVSKKMHNALQGNRDITFSEEEISLYLDQAKNTYEEVHPEGDYVIIHDPQPCPVIKHAKDRKGKWIWRCHIDTSDPNLQAWNLVSEFIPMYDAQVFTKNEYARNGLHYNLFQIPPSIDPFDVKNKPLEEETAKDIAEKFVPLDLPIVTQVSRFDPWKDPLGVIDAYRIIKKELPCRLVLIGSLASDDPEGMDWLKKTKSYAGDDPNIHILSNLDGVGSLEVNAFQHISDVVFQKSIKEGFGLTVTEALWKETPVIGGNVGGIKLQIENGINGFLVDTVEEAAEKAIQVLKDPEMAKEMGKKGREKVKNEFLLLRQVEKYLDLFKEIS
ncbi:MAG: Trehalose synthase [Promethearchaeota archaeon]|nr:MAG: Trehalose synthase [Candidatus Lokiarchaeota archaeon]